MDVTPTLTKEVTKRYQQLICILHGAIELDRIDILTEVSCLSQHLAVPRDGHLNVIYKISKYLQTSLRRHRAELYSTLSILTQL